MCAGGIGVNAIPESFAICANAAPIPVAGAVRNSTIFRVATLHQIGHERNVAASAKRASRPGDNHHANTAIAACVLECFSEIATHVTDKRVQPVGTIQCDEQDAVAALGQNGLVGHGGGLYGAGG